MLEAQKKLLADIAAVEKNAVALFNSGVKISTIIQKVRSAREELDARVRFIERNEKPKPAAKPASAPKAPAKPNT